ncbi:MAG: hypothetical protein ACJA2S_002292 [Cyclobacteriaceae bacterium]|jgi:hypothetical protein
MKLANFTRILTFFLSLLLITDDLSAQSISGNISDEQDAPLPFATIYIRNIETGTSSNKEGYFAYNLPAGKYDIVFQYLGYESIVKFVEISSTPIEINVKLKPHTFMLKDIVVKAGKEDPAYTIMRKAIAKSKYHLQQLDSSTSQVYIKGSGRLIDSPFFLRKVVAKEGVDSTTAFVSESIIDLKYTRPNNYEQHVVSIRSSGNDNNTSPSQFINGSFYEPKIANAISPLSPKAFAYYRFEYLGTFKDREYEVSKIRVIPRSRGDGVFAGELFIVEDYWSIHSLDLKTSYLGIEFNINQIYNPIENKAWMPVSHKFYIHGTFFGFEFEYNYLATISQYEITLNPDLISEIVVVDEKVDKVLAAELKEQNLGFANETIEKLNSGQQLTRKELRKLMRDYEKKEKENDSIPEVEYITSVTIDSLARKLDSTYWEAQRPIPLSQYEIKGYKVMDSLTVVHKNEAEGDTIKTKQGKEGFHLTDIVLGNTYKVGKKAHLKLKSPLANINFNTVEGYNFYYQMNFTKTFENQNWLKIEPTIRYAFSRKKVSGQLQTTYQFGEKNKEKSVTVTSGKYISQINPIDPILPVINSFTSLLYEDNYMKLYEKEFLALQFNQRISDKYRYSLKTEYANRLPLQNTTDHTWRDNKNKEYTSNIPQNTEIEKTSFTSSQAFLTEFNISVRPWIKYYIQNKRKRPILNSSPELTFNYKNALPIGDAKVSYHKIGATIKHAIDIGIRGTLNYSIGVGAFLSKDELTFLDFNHFQGNRTPIQTTDVVSSYRLLPFYQLSTQGSSLNLMTHYQFRKFFLSRFGLVQKRGIKESVFINYLGTNSSQRYTEFGYSMDNIFRVFRVEWVASFQDEKYLDWGVVVGITANLDKMFNFN